MGERCPTVTHLSILRPLWPHDRKAPMPDIEVIYDYEPDPEETPWRDLGLVRAAKDALRKAQGLPPLKPAPLLKDEQE